MLRYPPHYVADKYIFKEDESSSNKGLCACFSAGNQDNAEIYISPSQVISRKQFLGED
jgi:hypothetical protein